MHPRAIGHAVWCGRGAEPAGRHGRYTAWYDNGQLATDGIYKEGALFQELIWDPAGRIESALDPATGQRERMWWHSAERPAVRALFLDGRPHNTWQEFDEQGGLVSSLLYDHGQPGKVKGESQLLRTATQAELPQPPFALPTSGSFRTPPAPALLLDDSALAQPSSLAGKLPDTQGEPLRLEAPATLSWSGLAPVLAALRAAGQDRVLLSTWVEGLQWPPRSGPPALQGPRPISVLELHLGAPADPFSGGLALGPIGPRLSLEGDARVLEGASGTGPVEPGAAALSRALETEKARNPAQNTLLLTPSPDTTVQQLVEALEAGLTHFSTVEAAL